MNRDNSTPNNRRPSLIKEKPAAYRFEEPETTIGSSGEYPAAVNSRPEFANRQSNQDQRHFAADNDEKHLDQLALGFKIYAAISAVFACIPFIHLFVGIMMVTGGFDDGKNAPPPFFGWIFIVAAVIFISIGWGTSVCNFYAGRFLQERRNHTFCFVMSCINCAFMPLGTILGVFAIVVLAREQVKELFARENKIS